MVFNVELLAAALVCTLFPVLFVIKLVNKCMTYCTDKVTAVTLLVELVCVGVFFFCCLVAALTLAPVSVVVELGFVCMCGYSFKITN